MTGFRRVFALVLALGACLQPPCPAQGLSGGIPQPWEGTPAWLHFEQGKRLYEQKEFGKSLVEFDRAILARRDAFANARELLDLALASKEAKSAGGQVSETLAAFASADFLPKDYRRLVEGSGGSERTLFRNLMGERISEGHRAFLEALLVLLDYRPLSGLGDSMRRLEEEISLLSVYPEAEFWKGRVFALEGEGSLAERQYLRAFDMRASLEVPEDRYSILYALAGLYETEGDFVAWENVIKRILADDPVAGDPALDPYLRQAMMATLADSGFDRFVLLYRIEPSFSFEANAKAAEYYLERGRSAASLHAAVATGMIVTRAVSMLRSRDRDYVWKDLADFRARAASRPEVAAYLEDRGFDRLLLVLADAMYAMGSRVHAATLWRSVAATGRVPYAAVASRRLAEPATAIRAVAPGGRAP